MQVHDVYVCLSPSGGPMKRLLVAVATLAGSMFALPALSQAQSATISGRVTAETGEAIPAVTVSVPHTQRGRDHRRDGSLFVRHSRCPTYRWPDYGRRPTNRIRLEESCCHPSCRCYYQRRLCAIRADQPTRGRSYYRARRAAREKPNRYGAAGNFCEGSEQRAGPELCGSACRQGLRHERDEFWNTGCIDEDHDSWIELDQR